MNTRVINANRIDGTYKNHLIGWSEELKLYPSMDYTYTISAHMLGGYDQLGKWSIVKDTLILDNFPKINKSHFIFSELFDSTLDMSTFKLKCIDESGEVVMAQKVIFNDTIERNVLSINGEINFVGAKVRRLRCQFLSADSEIKVKEGVNAIVATLHLLPTLQTSMYPKWKITKDVLIPYDNDSLVQTRKLSK